MAGSQRTHLPPSLKVTLKTLLQQHNSTATQLYSNTRHHCCSTSTFTPNTRGCWWLGPVQESSNCKRHQSDPQLNLKESTLSHTHEHMLWLTWNLSTNLFASNLFISSINPPLPPPLLVRLASLLETPLGLDPPEPSSGLRQKSTLKLMKII